MLHEILIIFPVRMFHLVVVPWCKRSDFTMLNAQERSVFSNMVRLLFALAEPNHLVNSNPLSVCIHSILKGNTRSIFFRNCEDVQAGSLFKILHIEKS